MTTTAGTFQVLPLSGSPRERGRIHGEVLRPLIHEGVQRWREFLGRSSDMDVDSYLDLFVESTDFVPALDRWAPGILEEARGIAEGAGLSWRDVYAYQLPDEEWLFRGAMIRARKAESEHCSALAVFDPGRQSPLLAQNMDLPAFYDGTQVLLAMQNEAGETEALIFTAAGLLATTGINRHGVGVCCNTVAQLAFRSTGLPVLGVVRQVLTQRTLSDAVTFVRSVSHASGQNYTIGGPDGAVALECSATQVTEFRPMATRVFHTNHPLANDDLNDAARQADRDREAQGLSVLSNSELRFRAVEKALADPGEEITVDAVASVLSDTDVPVCVVRSPEGTGITFGSLIMELSVPPVLRLAPGPPAHTEYQTYTF
jgi:isopenicillin-N N-acyltransferase-like protein